MNRGIYFRLENTMHNFKRLVTKVNIADITMTMTMTGKIWYKVGLLVHMSQYIFFNILFLGLPWTSVTFQMIHLGVSWNVVKYIWVHFKIYIIKSGVCLSVCQHYNVPTLTSPSVFKLLHNGGNDSHKRQFLALGVCSQSWKLNNLSN